MIQVTLDGAQHWLWPYEPEWGRGVVTRFELGTDTVSALTKREGRRAYTESLRVETEASYILGGGQAAAVRNALRGIQDTPIRMPLAPAMDDLTGDWEALWWMAHDGDGANLYWTQNRNDLSGRLHIGPTLLGYLVEAVKFELLTTSDFLVNVRWRESSDFAERLELGAQAWDQGPAIGARTIYRFPFLPDFGSGQDAGAVVVEVQRESLGFTRKASSVAYPQIGGRTPVLNYTLRGSEVAKLLRFFLDRGGTVEPFWVPCWVEECRLTQDVLAADTTLQVSNAAALGDHRYILLYDGKECWRKVTGIAGNQLTLEAAVGADFGKDSTLICTLALARFSTPKLTATWESPDLAMCQVSYQEVPEEYAPAVGEVYGTSLGPLPAKCFLFELSLGAEVWRWTSYEKDLNYGGQAYSSVAIGLEDLTDGLAWESTDCRVRLRNIAGNPIGRLLTRTANARLGLVVAEGKPTNPGTSYSVLFRGWVTTASLKGPWLDVDAAGFGSLFTRQIPRTLMQPTDNYALFDAGNRLVRADWTFTCRAFDLTGLVLSVDTITWPGGALPAIGANYFALGYLERPGALERIPIMASTALAAGVVTVTLAHAPTAVAPVLPEAGWKLVPGYDGLSATATAKFNNLANFGGFPEVPSTDPSLVPVKKSSGGGGKK